MKHSPSQTPIYRLVESLMVLSVPMVCRLPKSVPYQVLGGRFITTVNECLDIIAFAYNLDRESVTYESARKECYGNLHLRLLSLKTTMRVLKKVKFVNHKGDVAPVIAPRHEYEFVDIINQISVQADAWLGGYSRKR